MPSLATLRRSFSRPVSWTVQRCVSRSIVAPGGRSLTSNSFDSPDGRSVVTTALLRPYAGMITSNSNSGPAVARSWVDRPGRDFPVDGLALAPRGPRP